jgi:hypothetical protein
MSGGGGCSACAGCCGYDGYCWYNGSRGPSGRGGGPGQDPTRGIIAEVIAASDTMGMDDPRRGAQRVLYEMGHNPQGLAMVLQRDFGVQDIARLMRELEARCNAVLVGDIQSWPMMAQGGSGSTGTGGGAGIPGGWPGAMAGGSGFGGAGMTPSVGDPRAGAQAGPYGQMGNQSAYQSVFGGRHSSAVRGPYSAHYGYGPSNHAGGTAHDTRRGGDPRSNGGGQDGRSRQPSMYGSHPSGYGRYFGWGRN